MEYVLTLRPVNDSDLSSKFRFLPEEEEIETCLQSLQGEMEALHCLADVKRDGVVFYLTSCLDAEEIRNVLKPVLFGGVTDFVRFVSIQ